MYSYKFGGKNGSIQHLDIADDLVVVRTKKSKALQDAIKSKEGKSLLARLSPVTQFPDFGVFVMQCKHKKEYLVHARDNTRKILTKEKEVRFTGRVLRSGKHGSPVVYTENFFIKLKDDLSPDKCKNMLKKYGLKLKKRLKYAKNAYFVSAAEGTGLDIFRISQKLLDENDVDLCHPELVRQSRRRSIPSQQWHLHKTTVNGKQVDAHINVKGAWKKTKGNGVTIAIIDDGVDIDHEEFKVQGKIVKPRDVTLQTNNPRPKDPNPMHPENHGTACAGVACAAGKKEASGVAPEAKLMPIRLASGLGSQAEADAFEWATDNGADVISCSWGPSDGEWWNPNDALHYENFLLPDSSRLAIDYAIKNGRNGKGCVVTWAAGNGNESVEYDGYASYDRVIAVAACNDRNSRSVYSDFGKSVWCSFPSSDFSHNQHPAPKTQGIWTTDRSGKAGYNPGVLNPYSSNPPGDDHGNYANDFGGTSSSCPGIAGIAALIISSNPDLRWDQVKNILRQSSIKIDPGGGDYDSTGHSPFYGYGRPDAAKAVDMAKKEKDAGPIKLSLGAAATGKLEKTGAEKLFTIDLPVEATIKLDGPNDMDFDLYIKQGSHPTKLDYDLRAWTQGSNETLEVKPEAPGLYYIMVCSYSGSGKFILKVALS